MISSVNRVIAPKNDCLELFMKFTFSFREVDFALLFCGCFMGRVEFLDFVNGFFVYRVIFRVWGVDRVPVADIWRVGYH